MELETLRRCLDEPRESSGLLTALRLSPSATNHTNLARMAQRGVPLDLLGVVCDQFAAVAPRLADPDMAWNNLEGFLTSARNPLSTAALFERDPQALPHLLQLFSSSQHLSELLVTDHEAYDLLRMTEGSPVSREALVDELLAEMDQVTDIKVAMSLLRRTKRRETLRIAYGDLVRNQALATVSRQLSFLADAIIEAAFAFAIAKLSQEFGAPRGPTGQPAQFCVLALGKLGGVELNYSSDIDLVFFYDVDGRTDGQAERGQQSIENREFFDRLSRDLIRLLGEVTDLGAPYRVDMRLRPDGSRGPLCLSYNQMVSYYDVKGRTWERQAFIKARAAAGHLPLGDRLLAELEPWIYRRYLSLTDIAGIRSLKRRIEVEAGLQQGPLKAAPSTARKNSATNAKTGPGGIRDIEFVLQFLQLVNGGGLPEIRTGNTLDAIAQLEKAGCLTPQERGLLEEHYCMLRKLEHRLQLLLDLHTHTLPASDEELRKLAIRMGYADTAEITALAAFKHDYQTWTEVNRKILDHLLHDAFDGDPASEPDIDLVNDPDPSEDRIREVLSRYPFEDIPAAYANLMELATEKIRFLSPRRCRHFLASIAPRLLAAIAKTPEPDTTLLNLARASDSLGGKAALWELFSENQPSLNLYVTLCAACPYLAGILTSNPGMIDELMDSLLVDQLPSLEMQEAAIVELTRGAEDLQPILYSFKNAQHLRVGVRDILGKDDIRSTHRALSDTAEVCLREIIKSVWGDLVERYGLPTVGELPEDLAETDPQRFARLSPRVGEECELTVVALGKLGGREPNYHSDLDLIFLYEADGSTIHKTRGREAGTSNSHFFSELSQRIVKLAGMGPQGRLYEVDTRLRPTGKSGPLAMPLDGLLRYFRDGLGKLWERQALCKARVLTGSPRAQQSARYVLDQAAYEMPWQQEFVGEIREMRMRMQSDATDRNLKRGPGGTVDVEFIVQMLQLKHGGDDTSLRQQGTLDALSALQAAGYLPTEDAEYFSHTYRFQRDIEAGIRLMDHKGRHELPTEEADLRKLAFLLGYADPWQLEREALETFAENRHRFDRYLPPG